MKQDCLEMFPKAKRAGEQGRSDIWIPLFFWTASLTWYVGCIHAPMSQLILSLEGQVKDVLKLENVQIDIKNPWHFVLEITKAT